LLKAFETWSLARALSGLSFHDETQLLWKGTNCCIRHVNDQIVPSFEPQLVVSQKAERYLFWISNDCERSPFFLYPSLRTEPLPVSN
jgi:hypothetical protein